MAKICSSCKMMVICYSQRCGHGALLSLHVGDAPHLWRNSATSRKTQVKEITNFSLVSFSVFESVTG